MTQYYGDLLGPGASISQAKKSVGAVSKNSALEAYYKQKAKEKEEEEKRKKLKATAKAHQTPTSLSPEKVVTPEEKSKNLKETYYAHKTPTNLPTGPIKTPPTNIAGTSAGKLAQMDSITGYYGVPTQSVLKSIANMSNTYYGKNFMGNIVSPPTYGYQNKDFMGYNLPTYNRPEGGVTNKQPDYSKIGGTNYYRKWLGNVWKSLLNKGSNWLQNPLGLNAHLPYGANPLQSNQIPDVSGVGHWTDYTSKFKQPGLPGGPRPVTGSSNNPQGSVGSYTPPQSPYHSPGSGYGYPPDRGNQSSIGNPPREPTRRPDRDPAKEPGGWPEEAKSWYENMAQWRIS